LNFLKETDYLTDKEADSIREDIIELIKILTTIIKTTRSNSAK